MAKLATPEGVPPGEHTPRVRLRDVTSGRVAESFRSVTVVATP